MAVHPQQPVDKVWDPTEGWIEPWWHPSWNERRAVKRGQALRIEVTRRHRIASLIAGVAAPGPMDPISLRLRKLSRIPDDETDEQYRRRRAMELLPDGSQKHARWCGDCGVTIPPDAPVWLQMIYPESTMPRGGFTSQLVVVCRDCGPGELNFGRHECAGCGRPVYDPDFQQAGDKICSDRCAEIAAYRARNKAEG